MVVAKIMGGPGAGLLDTHRVSPDGGGGGPRINYSPGNKLLSSSTTGLKRPAANVSTRSGPGVTARKPQASDKEAKHQQSLRAARKKKSFQTGGGRITGGGFRTGGTY